MLPKSVPSIDPLLTVIGVVVAVLLVTLLALVLRARRQRGGAAPEAPLTIVESVPAPKQPVVDMEGLLAAVKEAEVDGASHRLPGLYLSLAQGRLGEGEPVAAADLLRRCIRVATTSGHKEALARARVALGDIAQEAGDPSTACEHWQIARLLFHELRQMRDYEAVDERMQRNKCPTDWVLTDF